VSLIGREAVRVPLAFLPANHDPNCDTELKVWIFINVLTKVEAEAGAIPGNPFVSY